MTDQDRPQDEPEYEPGFDDPAYDDVRDLLASARVTDPVPADVVARLDDTLASLTADRRGAAADLEPDDAPAVVVPLRRRSRVAPRLLAAAVAVVVVGAGGIGLSQVLETRSSDDMATADSAESAGGDDFGAIDPESAPAPAAPRDQDLNGLTDGEELTRLMARTQAVPRFTTAAFATQVAAFSGRNLALPWSTTANESGSPISGDGVVKDNSKDARSTPSPTGSPFKGTPLAGSSGSLPATRGSLSYSAAKAACPGPIGTPATLVPILYDGQPASLAVHPPSDGTQLYEAWSCDGRTMLASAVVQP